MAILIQAAAQAIVILYPGVLVFWLVMHTKIDRWRRVGKKAYWIASAGWPATALPLLYFRSAIFSAQWRRPLWLQLVGAAAFLAAVALAREASKVMTWRTLVGLPELEPQKRPQPVLSTGIYTRTRNPIYLAHWLVIFSAAAVTGFAANWIFFALDCLLLPLMILAEERELLSRYGPEFGAYMRRVPRFFPKCNYSAH